MPYAARFASLSEELTNLSAVEIVGLVSRGDVSPVEIVEAHLARIERLNPRLNAIVTLAPDALARARTLEARLTRGENVGSLAGVPVTVKDTIETEGMRTTFGSRVFQRNVPPKDAPAVSRLLRAGAIILGKTNASEFALDYTAENLVFGRTNNPFDDARTPGGSSGGCAAAVCACLTAVGLGSDLAGSIRIPTHFCGVAGLRPTAGRVPGAGHLPPIEGRFALGASLGPIARRVADLALLFDVLTASDKDGEKLGSGLQSLAEIGKHLRGRRVAWYAFDGSVTVSEETRRTVESAAKALDAAGLTVAEECPPHVRRAAELWLALFSGATEEFLKNIFAGREDEAGPVARLLLERAKLKNAPSPELYTTALVERERLRAELIEWMHERPILLAPVGSVAAYEHGTRKVAPEGREAFGVFRAFGYARAFNTLDLPSVSVRAGWTNEGMPIGVQVVARPGEDREALAVARVIEDVLGGWAGVPGNLSKADANPL